MEEDLETSARRPGEYGAEHHSHHHHHHSSHEISPRHSSSRSSRPHHHHAPVDFEGGRANREPNTGALVAAPLFLVLLVLGPLFYFQYEKGGRLARENDLLRAEVVRLSTEISTMKANPAEALAGGPEREMAEEAEPPALPPAESIAPEPAPGLVMRPIVRKTPAKKAPPAETRKETVLRKELALAPDGTFLDGAERRADGCAPALATAFYALSRGSTEDASVTLEGIVGSKPLWPYGHFYLAVATSDPRSFRETQKLLLEARLLRAISAEGELYLALASLFLREPAMAKEALARLETMRPDYARLHLGPLYAPKEAPGDLLERLESLAAQGLPRVVLLDGPKTIR